MFEFSSIRTYHAALLSGQATCVQTVRHYLSAIEQNSLNAFIEVYAEEALERAAQLDASQVKGKLHGVVIGLKDNICYKDHIASAASRMLKYFQSLFSATAVEKLLQEGAIIIGRQNCDEFGMGSTNEHSFYGAVPNPFSDAHVAGGSSGGSAAAVSAGLCMVSLGSDTGGSVRLPADFCGVVGYKPSYGRVSRHGLIAYASSFDQIGILSKNVEDASLVLEVIAGPDEFDSTALQDHLNWNEKTNTGSKRIAFFPEWIDHPAMDPEIRTAIKNFLDELSEKGHFVEPVSFPLNEYIVPAYYVLTTAEASSNLSRYDGARYGYRSAKTPEELSAFYQFNRTEGFGKEVKKRILLGTYVLSTGYYDAYFTQAQKVRQLLVNQTNNIFENYDFLLAPNAPNTAYKRGLSGLDPMAMYLGDIFTVFANLVGIPSISLPVFKHSSNLPFGLQVLSSPQNEVSLQRFTHQLMQQ